MALEVRNREEDGVPVLFTGFPVRSLTRNVGGRAGGEWVLAYQMQQKRRFRLSVSSTVASLSDHGPSTRLTTPENTLSTISAHRHQHILNKSLLLKQGFVDNPSDLCIIDISGGYLNHFKDGGFEDFDSLACIMASDNQLPLEAFLSFPVLQELEISLNGISSVDVTHESFVTLRILDLSYNYLTHASVVALGKLPQLVELHLTGNNLVSVPSEMSRPYKVQTDCADSEIRISFPKLEKLWVDDNKLCDPTTFAVLAGLRKLKYLNLDSNELVTIPHLKLMGTNNSLLAGAQHQPSGMSVQDRGSKGEEGEVPDTPLSSLAPFPQLQTISLRNNMILNGRGLLPCSTWPVLREIIIIGNPLVSMQRGLPQLVQDELVERSNINVIRNPVDDNKTAANLRGKAKEFRKVSLTPPPLIPKQPLLLAIEPVPRGQEGTALSSNPSPTTYYSDNEGAESVDVSTVYSVQKNQDSNKQASVFLTEFNQDDHIKDEVVPSQTVGNADVKHHQSSHDNEESSTAADDDKLMSVKEMFALKRKKEQERFSNVPSKYKGFESLLNDEDDGFDDSPPLPPDQHSCQKVLKYALNHPLLMKSQSHSSEKLAAIQPGQYLKKRPSSDQYHTTAAVSSRTVKVSSLMDELKTHQATAETNLKQVLGQKELVKTFVSGNGEGRTKRSPRQQSSLSPTATASKSEGEQLFTKLQAKYDKVREISLATLAIIDSAQHIAKTASQS